jgi:hypothetical protein
MADRTARIETPDGRTLTVRPATPRDVDGLMALYESLSSDDRHRRFFTLSRPRRELLEHFVEATGNDGLWLVAVTDDGEVVADGGYSRQPDGDAEFALTVRQDWRGGVGSHLFDLILRDAAAHGVENLRGDILRENRPMLRIIEEHGYATIDQPDWTMVEATVSTHGGRPSWPPVHRHRRVLVEECGGRWSADAEAWAAGWDIITCPGPGARSVGTCPLLAGEHCPLVDGADAVVVAGPSSDPNRDALLAAHHRSTSTPPVVDEALASAGTISDLLAGQGAPESRG